MEDQWTVLQFYYTVSYLEKQNKAVVYFKKNIYKEQHNITKIEAGCI